jgi:hypothetical protein
VEIDFLIRTKKKEVRKMRRLLGLMLVTLALTFTGVSSFAASMKEQTKQVATSSAEMIKGEITHIKGHTLTLKDEAGKTHYVKAADMKELKGLKVGEKVSVKMEKGKATSIQRIENTASAESTYKGK